MAGRTQYISLKWLLVGTLITSTAMSFIWPLNTIYIHETLHKSLVIAAIVLCLNQLATMFGNWFGGILFDDWDPYYAVLVGIVTNIIAFGLLIFLHSWPYYAILLVFSGFANGISSTCENSLATVVEGRKSSYVFNALYFMINLGLVIGTLAVGYILPLGIQYVFAVATAIQIVFLFVAIKHYRVKTVSNARYADVKRPKNLLTFKIFVVLLAVLIGWMVYEQWQSNISTFMIQEGFRVKDYSFLWTFNAILIVMLQPIVTYFDNFLVAHIRGRLNVGLLLLSCSFALLLFPFKDNYFLYIFSICLLTMGEILLFPGASSFVDLQTSDRYIGYFQGKVQMYSAAGKAVGPLFGALVIDNESYEWLFLICVVVVFITILIFNIPFRLQREKGESS